MSITRAKSLETLYEECKDFDLVLVPDAPLASALNRYLDKPHFGPFAVTPRRLVTQNEKASEERLAFLEVTQQTDLNWKEAAYAVRNILQCWEHQGRVDSILEYDSFATPATETAVDCLAHANIPSRRLSEYTIGPEQSIAVIGLKRFTELERSIFPPEYETIDPFLNKSFEYPPVRIFDSVTAIVETILNTITHENADQIGVVLDETSDYASLVESTLEAADIPYYGGPGFTDNPHHRAFLQLLRQAHASRETRVGDIRPLLTELGIEIDTKHDNKRLDDLNRPELDWFRDFSDAVETYTFNEALDAYETETDSELSRFRDELTTLGIHDTQTTEPAVDRLDFYLQSYEIPVERDNEGVLLADAKSAAHVDRPIVFALGLDEGWTHTYPTRPWIDREEEFDRNLRQFQLLLQSGTDQYYLVQDVAGGTPITPCLYFEDLFDDPIEQFDDLNSISYSPPAQPTQDGFAKEPVDTGSEPIATISQSSLNTYVNSPRDYAYSRLVENPEKDYLVEGSLFHDFAEFYVSTSNQITQETLDECAELILEKVDPFLRDVDRTVRRTKYRLGLRTIAKFLEANPPATDAFLTADGGHHSNFFSEHYNEPINTPYTESWFEDPSLGLKGKVDLVYRPTHLLDYKSGSKKSTSTLINNASVSTPSDTPDFQALLYLTHLRTERPDETLEFTFFYFLETLDELVTGDADLDDCFTTITYHPVAYDDYITRPAVFEELQTEAAKDCQKTFSQVEYNEYRAAFEAHDFPTTDDSNELIASDFGQALIERMQEAVGDYKYVINGCKQALRQLLRIREQSYYRDDLDAFETFIQDQLEELNTRRIGDERFPVEGLGGEPNYRRIDHRDCILEGEVR